MAQCNICEIKVMHHHDRKIQNSERLRHLENPEKNCDSWELKLPKSKGMTDRKTWRQLCGHIFRARRVFDLQIWKHDFCIFQNLPFLAGDNTVLAAKRSYQTYFQYFRKCRWYGLIFLTKCLLVWSKCFMVKLEYWVVGWTKGWGWIGWDFWEGLKQDLTNMMWLWDAALWPV